MWLREEMEVNETEELLDIICDSTAILNEFVSKS